MKKILKILFLVVILMFIMNCYCLYEIKKNIKKEGFAETSNTDLIKKEISNIYQADINAIRNLASISEKLQSGGKNGLLTIPGNVKIEGELQVDKNINAIDDIKSKNLISSNNIMGANLTVTNAKTKNLNVSKDINCSNTIHGLTLHAKKNNSYIGYSDNKNYLRGINRMEGNVETGMNIAGNLNVKGTTTTNNLNVKGNINLTDGKSKIISGPNTISFAHWAGISMHMAAYYGKLRLSNGANKKDTFL